MGIGKKIFLGLSGIAVLGLIGGASFAAIQSSAFDSSLSKIYDIPLPAVNLSSDPEVIERGEHLAHSIGGCASADCHGSDFSGGKTLAMGPVGTIVGSNITSGGKLGEYSDGELARLLTSGVKKDGTSVLMMPVQDFSWMPKRDIDALISYLRTAPSSSKASGKTEVKILGKILDRQDKFVWDVARFVSTIPKAEIKTETPDAEYGQFVVRLCTGCHGETLSGGPIPGAPPSLPIPLNITMHESGIKDYGYDDFVKVLKTGIRKNGTKLDPFMATDLTQNLNETELKALWAELKSRPPKTFGGR